MTFSFMNILLDFCSPVHARCMTDFSQKQEQQQKHTPQGDALFFCSSSSSFSPKSINTNISGELTTTKKKKKNNTKKKNKNDDDSL